jgi:circadian clock protein KaiB
MTDQLLQPADFGFELYVDGRAGTAAQQTAFARRVLTLGLAGRYALRVVDVDATPEIAQANGVTETPTLVRLWPPPIQVLVGQPDVHATLLAMDLPRPAPRGPARGDPVGLGRIAGC